MLDYKQFVASKRAAFTGVGVQIETSAVHPLLMPFQRDIVRWACAKGRCAVFADTGLGKTYIQLEWVRLMGQNTLIIAPLTVARQTARMAKDIGLDVHYVRSQDQVTPGHALWITNYEMLEHFDASQFGAVVLDESSILKALDGKTRRQLTEMFVNTPYRLACTATPAPNDRTEIGNHAEFLGICKMNEMLAMFFVHANKETVTEVNGYTLRKKQSNDNGQEWRLKHHAEESFYHWMATWAMSIRRPSDLGYDDDGFNLPALTIHPHWLDFDYRPDDKLVFTGLEGLSDHRNVLRKTLDLRCEETARQVNGDTDQWIVWCHLNDESAMMAGLIPDCVEVVGADSPEKKAEAIEAFQDGKYRVLVTKPSIAGFGMNFQNAHKQAFVGLSYSWEEWYQAIRRCYRFGQTKPVDVHVVMSTVEREVYETVMNKERVARSMAEQLITHVRNYEMNQLSQPTADVVNLPVQAATVTGETWTAMLGDSCLRLTELRTNSIDLSVYSPPFADLYTYSNSEFDLGNSRDYNEFFHTRTISR